MAINRFYNPSRGQYISQFVPQQLPVELLTRGILAKRAVADKREENMMTTIGDWKQAALPGYDTDYVKGWKRRLEDFVTKSQGMDKTSPQFQREYLQLQNELKGDENISKVQASYDRHQKFLSTWEDYVKAGNYKAADALRNEYDRTFNIYTAKDGKGFSGEVQLDDPLIRAGINTQQEIEKLFDQIKGDSFESVRNLRGQDLYYSVKSGGIGDKKIQNAALKQFSNFYDGDAGLQLQAEYKAKNIPHYDEKGKPITQAQYLSRLSPEERQAFEQGMMEDVYKTVIGVGDTFKYSTFETGEADALDKAGDIARENPADPLLSSTSGAVLSLEQATNWEKRITGKQDRIADIEAELKATGNAGKGITGGVTGKTYNTRLASAEYYKGLEEEKARLQNEIQLEKLSKATTWKQLETETARKYPGVQKELAEIEALRATGDQAKIEIARAKEDALVNSAGWAQYQDEFKKEWNRYYTGDRKTMETFGLVTTAADSKVAAAESTLINANPAGYRFMTYQNGQLVELPKTDAEGNPISYSETTVTGLTTESVQGKGIARMGNIKAKVSIVDKDDPTKIKVVETSMPVFAFSNDPNDHLNKIQYATEFFTTSSQQKIDAQRKMAAGDPSGEKLFAASQLAENQGWNLISPGLGNTLDSFDKGTNDSQMTTITMPVKVGGTTEDIGITIKKLPATGEYELYSKNFVGLPQMISRAPGDYSDGTIRLSNISQVKELLLPLATK